MASSTRFTTPPFGSQPRDPLTPDNGLRTRSTTRPDTGNGSPDGDASPTSTTVSSPSVSRIFDRPLYRAVTSQPSSAMGTPARKVIIRADPTLFTCFDPVDKDLYDLWAPKQ
ncbi:hypothetical protein GSI_00824 [Ganoderma sinense ZZ0214-1]|uniref:Uncharacterized protein n=1 Tax=Ganoderma sinense ZZ0214-1 TaxID=1077348 RepID=A0A2G8STS4_9APHY|nr:hypothetical protein GSI_00824 [Ganoderma sinense ZZ0214-1]